MVLTVIIFAATVAAIILGILFFPKIKIKNGLYVDSYWVIALVGVILMLITGQTDLNALFNALTEDTAVNPIKILVLFVSMTVLSIFLDELGFFAYLADVTLKKAGANKFKLFSYLYAVVSVLTVFTSNDVIILSFTPFICYFAKNAEINPLPYLAGEFVAANTWSMALVIGNPTNIYLASAFNVGFAEYFKVMLLPTVIAGITAFCLLVLVFRKTLFEKSEGLPKKEAASRSAAKGAQIKSKPLLFIGVIHLGACTILLAISSYAGLPMWLISLGAAISLSACVLIFSAIKRRAPTELAGAFKRAPYQLIPFVLSMFAMITVLSEKGVTEKIASLLGEGGTVFKYGTASFFASDVVNNIPMSVLFCDVIKFLPQTAKLSAVYATTVGSNLGALFTPIGALAGIMWNSILTKQNVKFGYFDFIKIGVTVALPTLAATLLTLSFTV
ncbi:MAG TPA: hypothetical protein DEV87_04240 [Clostridiales bacterium]|nr:hypothetical protein [Clostridiales bacterium]